MNKIGIGLVGCGTVGSGLIRNLPKANGLIAQRLGIQLEIRGIAVKDPSKTRPDLPLPAAGDWKKVVADPAVQIVVELVGGTSESFSIAEACIKARKPFVTANKALLAERGQELIELAQKSGSPIYFEASVAGGIPVLKALREGLVANQLLGLHGIINGTSNYILTRMAEAGSDFSTALKEAKDLDTQKQTIAWTWMESMPLTKPPSSAFLHMGSFLSSQKSQSKEFAKSHLRTSPLRISSAM